MQLTMIFFLNFFNHFARRIGDDTACVSICKLSALPLQQLHHLDPHYLTHRSSPSTTPFHMMHSPPFHPHPHTVGACASSPAEEEVQGLVIGPTIEEGEAALLAELRHMWSSSGGSVVIDIPVRAARAACA